MEFITLIAIMAIILVVMAWSANTNKRNKIYCTIRRVNKTKIEKFVKMTSRFVIFDGGKYDIIPSRITFIWWNKGLIHQLFPQWVASLDFTWSSRWPHDPNKLHVTAETPRTRNALNKEEWVESYYKGAKPSSKIQKNMIEQYLPWIALIGVGLVGAYLYTTMQGMAMDLADLRNTINTLTR